VSCEPPDHSLRLNRFVLGHTETLLGEVLLFRGPADALLAGAFRARRALGRRDRATISEIVFAVLRHLRSLRWLLGEDASPRQLALAALVRHVGVAPSQIADLLEADERRQLDGIGGASLQEAPAAVRAELPDWIWERLVAEQGDAATPLAAALATPAPLDLRVNPLRGERDDVLARLQEQGLAAAPTPWSPLGIRLAGKPSLVGNPLLLEGLIEVQDEGSQLLGLLTAPRPRFTVVDFCAGAGGKTLLLGALMRSTGRLYALDVSARRLERMRPRLKRSGLSNVVTHVIDSENDVRVKRIAGRADRVLVDAPCTGLGTLRRNPDLKWRQTAADVDELADKQRRILLSALRLLKPGGRLVYATCSLLRQENDAVVDAVLASRDELAPVSAEAILREQGIVLECGERLRLTPQQHGTDGFFAAALERQTPR